MVGVGVDEEGEGGDGALLGVVGVRHSDLVLVLVR